MAESRLPVLRTVSAVRYVTPLREGGSLPAVVEGDDDGLYVMKFRGAGQGPKALVAELVAGELARALGLLLPDAALASRIVWFDAFVMNVDRTARNTNMLLWHRRLWLIDHGAALYFQHQWDGYMARSISPFPPVRDHVLLPFADALEEADTECRARLSDATIAGVVDLIPDDWLRDTDAFADAPAQREAYRRFLGARLEASRTFVEEAIRARSLRV
jgi:hypothetical protein